jgi:hypothetical protein
VEGTTSSSGAVTFASLPTNSTYDLLLVPATLSPRATTTTVLALAVPSGGTSQTVQLRAKTSINGQLLAPAANAGSGSFDLSTVTVFAYDQSSDSPETPNFTTTNADGSFSLGVTPGRTYVLLAMPPTGSGAARTFVGPGPMQASEFTVTQELLPSITWEGTVRSSDASHSPIGGTVLQIRCKGGVGGLPYCFDPTLPLAEATADADGALQFALADQTKR